MRAKNVSDQKAPRQRLVSLSEAAEYAGVVPRTIRRRIADGSLIGYRMGPRLIRVDLNELDAILVAHPFGDERVSPPGRQDRPSGNTEAVSESFGGDKTQRTPFGRQWPCVLERRRAARELDRLLGVFDYPDVAVTYDVRSLRAAS